jgi:hypothetical protein
MGGSFAAGCLHPVQYGSHFEATSKELTMKKALITLLGVVVLGATLPALAGPDFQLIEQARKAKQERLRLAQAQQQQTPPQSDQHAQMEQMMKMCMAMMNPA